MSTCLAAITTSTWHILHSQNSRIRLFIFSDAPRDRTVVIHTHLTTCNTQVLVQYRQTPHTGTASPLVLILSVIVQAIPTFPFNEKMSQMLLLFFVATIAPRSASATGPTHPAEVHIYEKPLRRLALCHITLLLLLYIHPNNTMPARFPINFSLKPSQTSQRIDDATATTRSRSSTTITMLEEEFGMCELHKSGATASSSFYSLALRLLLNLSYFVSPDFLSKLHIHIPKRRRRLSSEEESWEILWDYDSGEDMNLPQSPLGFPPGRFPGGGERDSELDQDVATPTSGTAWSSDAEPTPLISSHFPRTPHPNALSGEGHPDGELLGISAPSPIKPDTL
jgi:hypothetical protein